MAFPGRWWHEPDAQDGEDDGAISVDVFPRTLLIALRCFANKYSISADMG